MFFKARSVLVVMLAAALAGMTVACSSAPSDAPSAPELPAAPQPAATAAAATSQGNVPIAPRMSAAPAAPAAPASTPSYTVANAPVAPNPAPQAAPHVQRSAMTAPQAAAAPRSVEQVEQDVQAVLSAPPAQSAPAHIPLHSSQSHAKGQGQPHSHSQQQPQPGATTFRDYDRSPVVRTSEDSVSTFSLDTDRTSYHLALSWARSGFDVEPDSVRAEEWINAFHYDYDQPSRADSFAVHTHVLPHPLDESKLLARIGFQAPELQDDNTHLNVTLVLDASGSMADGNRVDIARQAADSIRKSLSRDDRISVVHFTDGVLHDLTVSNAKPNDRSVRRSIARLEPHGSTNVQAGLNQGVTLANEMRNRRTNAYNYIILMSDGVANVDATNPFAILESAGDYNRANPIRLITIGVGIANYNDYLLEQLAQHGNGWYRYLNTVEQAQSTFSRQNWLALSIPFADQTRAQVTWNAAVVDTWRIIGYENRITQDHLFTEARKEFAEIPSGAATTVFYELNLAEHISSREAAHLGDVEVRWVTPISNESNRQHAPIVARYTDDALLHLGALVALASDRYSGLPNLDAHNSRDIKTDLNILKDDLRDLERRMGKMAAYRDFAFLLDHIVQDVPSQATGYSR